MIFSMLREINLYHVDLILQQIMIKPYIPFGGVCVILIRYISQIPPVLGYLPLYPFFDLMWTHKANICGVLNSVFRLKYNHQLNRENPDTFFNSFLKRLCDGVNTGSNWVMVRDNCGWYYTSPVV